MRCREYLVVSAAENCAQPETEEVITVKPSVLLSNTLRRWNASGEPQPAELIVLTMLDEWAAAHPAIGDCATRSAPELLQEFVRTIAVDNTGKSSGDPEKL
ncbi:MAG: hypothetical protein JOZ83_10030 [Silvibacterium sp.]|nr:hypothetical protein [Silvibacterium sp.]